MAQTISDDQILDAALPFDANQHVRRYLPRRAVD